MSEPIVPTTTGPSDTSVPATTTVVLNPRAQNERVSASNISLPPPYISKKNMMNIVIIYLLCIVFWFIILLWTKQTQTSTPKEEPLVTGSWVCNISNETCTYKKDQLSGYPDSVSCQIYCKTDLPQRWMPAGTTYDDFGNLIHEGCVQTPLGTYMSEEDCNADLPVQLFECVPGDQRNSGCLVTSKNCDPLVDDNCFASFDQCKEQCILRYKCVDQTSCQDTVTHRSDEYNLQDCYSCTITGVYWNLNTVSDMCEQSAYPTPYETQESCEIDLCIHKNQNYVVHDGKVICYNYNEEFCHGHICITDQCEYCDNEAGYCKSHLDANDCANCLGGTVVPNACDPASAQYCVCQYENDQFHTPGDEPTDTCVKNICVVPDCTAYHTRGLCPDSLGNWQNPDPEDWCCYELSGEFFKVTDWMAVTKSNYTRNQKKKKLLNRSRTRR